MDYLVHFFLKSQSNLAKLEPKILFQFFSLDSLVVSLSLSIITNSSQIAYGGPVLTVCGPNEHVDPDSKECVCNDGFVRMLVTDGIRPGFFCVAKMAVGGEIIPLDTTMILAAGAQYTAAWMIPVLVSAIGIGIVIARKF